MIYIIEFEIDVFQIFLHLGAIFHGDSSTNPLVRPPPPVRSAVLDEQTKQCSQSGTLSRFELTTPESWPRV